MTVTKTVDLDDLAEYWVGMGLTVIWDKDETSVAVSITDLEGKRIRSLVVDIDGVISVAQTTEYANGYCPVYFDHDLIGAFLVATSHTHLQES